MNLEPLLTQKHISDAFKNLKRKKFRKDFSDLKRFSNLEQRHLNSLGELLNKNSIDSFYTNELKKFRFLPYIGLKIEKSNKKYRPLLIPHSKDRIVLTAIFPAVRMIIKPELEKYDALGLGIKNKEKNTECKKVLTEIQSSLKSGESRYVLKLDFKDFFSSIDRNILLRKLNTHFKGKDQRRIYRFIKLSIENKIEADADFHGRFGHLKLKIVGIPQGLSYSPLLASFYALSLDKITRRSKDYKGFRYLDDMIVLTKTEKQANKIYSLIKSHSEKLKLNLHPLEPGSKTQLLDVTDNRFEFLGIEIAKDKLYIPETAIKDFKETFQREIVNVNIIKKFNLTEVIRVYRNFAGGWVNHYKKMCPEHFTEVEKELTNYLDQYIEKHRNRKTIGKFFSFHRLTLSGHFLRIKS